MKNNISRLVEMCQSIRHCTIIDIDEDVLYQFENLLERVEVEQVNKPLDKEQLISLARESSYLYDQFDDMSNSIFDIIYNSSSYPAMEIWRLDPFSEIMREMKLTMYVLNNEFSIVPFSFGNFDTRNIKETEAVLAFVDDYDKYDVDNILTVLDVELYKVAYPQNFEERLLKSISRSSWTVKYYYSGFFDEFCEKNGFLKLKEYLNS